MLCPQESSSKTIDMEDIKRETSEEPGLTTIFAPPPEFQSSMLDSPPDTKTLENIRTKSADAFKATPSQPGDLFRTMLSNRADLPQASKGDNLFQAAQREDSSQATSTKDLDLFHAPPNNLRDPFHSPSNKEEDLFQSRHSKEADLFHTPATKGADLFQAPTDKGMNPSAKGNDLFHVAPTKENDLFHTPSEAIEDLFSTSSTRTDVPFPNLIDPFQQSINMPDPFHSSPFEPFDLFKDPPVPSKTQGSFHPSPSNSSDGTFNTTSNHNASKVTYSTPSFNSPPEMKSDVFSSSSVDKSPDLFRTMPSALAVKPPAKPIDILLTTPRGTKHEILQPTPFSQAGSVSMSPMDTTNELENEYVSVTSDFQSY